jgi:hypothetical protein
MLGTARNLADHWAAIPEVPVENPRDQQRSIPPRFQGARVDGELRRSQRSARLIRRIESRPAQQAPLTGHQLIEFLVTAKDRRCDQWTTEDHLRVATDRDDQTATVRLQHRRAQDHELRLGVTRPCRQTGRLFRNNIIMSGFGLASGDW